MGVFSKLLIKYAWAQLPRRGLVDSNVLPCGELKGKYKLPEFSPRFKKKGEVVMGWWQINDGYQPTAYSSSYHNEFEAIKARVLKQTPQIDKLCMQQFVAFVKKEFNHLFPNWHRAKPDKFSEYLRHSNASSSVKQQLLRARRMLDAQGVFTERVCSHLAYKWTTRKSFVKIENNLYSSPVEQFRSGVTLDGRVLDSIQLKDKAPRLIQGGEPEYVAILGPFFASLQRQVKKIWDSRSPLFFVSGASAKQVSEYILDFEGKLLEDDISSFDSSLHELLCELEIWMSKKFGASPLILQLMEFNAQTHGQTSHGIKYKVKGTRKSGDPFTSLYNSILNGLMHMFIYCKVRGCTLQQARSQVRMLLCGDDNLMRHLGPEINFKQEMLGLGFKSDAIYRDSIYDSEFCSNVFYDTELGPCLGPKLGRVLNKFAHFISPPKQFHPHSLMRGLALGFLGASSYVPVLRELCEYIGDKFKNHVAVYPKDLEHRLKFDGVGYMKYNYLLSHRYGLNAEQIDQMITDVKNKNISKIIMRLFDRDCDARKQIYIWN